LGLAALLSSVSAAVSFAAKASTDGVEALGGALLVLAREEGAAPTCDAFFLAKDSPRAVLARDFEPF
jgi:hypothetical protein